MIFMQSSLLHHHYNFYSPTGSADWRPLALPPEDPMAMPASTTVSSPSSEALPRTDDVLDCLEWWLLLMGVTLFLFPSEGSLLFRKSNNASSESFFFALAGLLLELGAEPPDFDADFGVNVVVSCPTLDESERWAGTLDDVDRDFVPGWGSLAEAEACDVPGFVVAVSSSIWKASAADLSSLLRKSSAFPVTADSHDILILGKLKAIYWRKNLLAANISLVTNHALIFNKHREWWNKSNCNTMTNNWTYLPYAILN